MINLKHKTRLPSAYINIATRNIRFLVKALISTMIRRIRVFHGQRPLSVPVSPAVADYDAINPYCRDKASLFTSLTLAKDFPAK